MRELPTDVLAKGCHPKAAPAPRNLTTTMMMRRLRPSETTSVTDFDAVVREFNDQQMSDAGKPVSQQQQFDMAEGE